MTDWRGHHEQPLKGQAMAIGSERGFGMTFAVVFAVIGLIPLLFGGSPRWWAVGTAGALLLTAAVMPGLLAPLNKVWHRIALLLHRIVSGVALILLFYGVVTLTGLVMRLLGRDLLSRRFDRNAVSYWIHQDSLGPEPESMRNQF